MWFTSATTANTAFWNRKPDAPIKREFSGVPRQRVGRRCCEISEI